jgi:hypothetical protein
MDMKTNTEKLGRLVIGSFEVEGVSVGGVAVFWENDPTRYCYGSLSVHLQKIAYEWKTAKRQELEFLFSDKFAEIGFPDSLTLLRDTEV